MTERRPHALDLFRLDGRSALVTGASRGLGLVMAEALAEVGASVCISSRSPDAASEAARALAAATGARVVGVAGDVSTPDGVERLARHTAETFGTVDILVNNAGVNIRGNIGDLSDADWDTVLDTNLKGPFLVARAFGPAMCARGWGRVINLSSMLATIALPGRAPYASSKAGVTALTRVLALEWASAGVTVNAICPGPFGTDMNRQLLQDPEKYHAFVQKLPVGRWGELHEIKGIAVFLASEASSYVTGASFAIDGGWTAQ
ncbi:MAG: 3-oxoacyl-ACP reductase FabG [Acidobacteria bacterium]|nr:3-oxoacyl-ACP reductase FabG [Acidobacteriota bacterium]